jgi:hypothetical protein
VKNHEKSAADEIADVRMNRPHVVLLGAGASRAAFLLGERNGKRLPVMADFFETAPIAEALASEGISYSGRNFEISTRNWRLIQPKQESERYLSTLYSTISHRLSYRMNRHSTTIWCSASDPRMSSLHSTGICFSSRLRGAMDALEVYRSCCSSTVTSLRHTASGMASMACVEQSAPSAANLSPLEKYSAPKSDVGHSSSFKKPGETGGSVT